MKNVNKNMSANKFHRKSNARNAERDLTNWNDFPFIHMCGKFNIEEK